MFRPGLTSRIVTKLRSRRPAERSRTVLSVTSAATRISPDGWPLRLSLAVLLDQSISPARQQQLRGVLAAAAGLDLAPAAKGGRGDRIELLPMAFDKTAAVAETRAAETAAKQSFRSEVTRNGAAVLVVILVALVSLFLAKQLLAAPRQPLDTRVPSGRDEPVAPQAPGSPPESILDLRGLRVAGSVPRQPAPAAVRMRVLAAERPDEVARQLQTWMAE